MSKSRKSFAEKIKEDFKPVILEEKEAQGRGRTKAVPGARLIPLSDIHPDPDQPRKKFDKEKLEELAVSIGNEGVIEPLTVRFLEDNNYYQIVTGERRFKAAQLAGLQEIPCIIKHLSNEEILTYQLIENLQREDLSPIDEANALKKLLEQDLTQVEVSKLIGKSQPYVSQILKILDLPKNILQQAKTSDVTKEHLLQLVKSKDPESLWQEIKTGKTAKQIKEKVTKEKPNKASSSLKVWVWTPEDKVFTIQVKFRKKNFVKEDIVKALKMSLERAQQLELFQKER